MKSCSIPVSMLRSLAHEYEVEEAIIRLDNHSPYAPSGIRFRKSWSAGQVANTVASRRQAGTKYSSGSPLSVPYTSRSGCVYIDNRVYHVVHARNCEVSILNIKMLQ